MIDRDTALALFLRRLTAAAPVDAAAVAAIEGLPCTVRSAAAGQYLLREGDPPRVCTLLLSGFIYRHKIVGDGGRQIVGIAMKGDIIDVQQMMLGVADHNVQALTDTVVAAFPSADLLARAETNAGIAKALWHYSLIESSITREWLTNTGRRDARTRTAHLVCELALRCELAGLCERQSFQLPMTQEQLGDTLGLTAVHINRTLRSLEEDGLIERTKRSITVADWPKLHDAGDFSPAYLHLESMPDRLAAPTGRRQASAVPAMAG